MKLSGAQKTEIKKHFLKLTNRELYDHLTINFGLSTGYTSFRMALYDLGLKKCKILRWTKEETKFLLDHYKTTGNIEIAKLLSKKGRVFTTKNIQKKMILLKIKRTTQELDAIRDNHKAKGTYSEANFRKWSDVKARENERRVWICNDVPRVMIKVEGSFIQYARYRWIQLNGEVPEGYKVYHKDCNPLNVDDDNLTIRNRCLNLEERKQYRRHIENYKLSLLTKDSPVIKLPAAYIPPEPAINMISVKIGKMTVKVKPGTDIDALLKRYENRHQVSHIMQHNSNLKCDNY